VLAFFGFVVASFAFPPTAAANAVGAIAGPILLPGVGSLSRVFSEGIFAEEDWRHVEFVNGR
jgi:hypothetical protein